MNWFGKKHKEETLQLSKIGGLTEEDYRSLQNCDSLTPAKSDSLPFWDLITNTYSNRSISAVYCCISLISNALSSMPLRVMQTDEHGHKQFVRHHPLQRIFNDKNVQTMSMPAIIKNVIQDVLLRGNGYILIIRGETGLVNSLKYIPAGSCSPVYNEYNDTLSYYISSAADGKKKTKYAPKDVIHITKDTRDGINGVAVTTYAKDVIELTKSAEEAAHQFFNSGMNVNGILSCKVNASQQQMQDLKTAWNSGKKNNQVKVTPFGVDYVQVGVDSERAQLLSSRQYQTVEICRYFNVPAQFLQSADKVTYTAGALEQMNLIFFQQTLLPFMICIESEFTRKLFTDDDLIVDMDETEFLMRTDKSTTANYLKTLVDSGIMTVNEARRELGLSEVADGDSLHIAYSDASKAKIGENE